MRSVKIKEQLKNHLFGGEAFMQLDEMLKKIPFDQLGVRPKELPYSFYELFYHIWYTQRDILEYCLKSDYSTPEWPGEYWPENCFPEDPEAWENLQKSYFEDRKKLGEFISSNKLNLDDPVPSRNEHSIFREVLLVIEHSAYHSGQLLIILRHLNLHSS